jgi:hypothetical protein
MQSQQEFEKIEKNVKERGMKAVCDVDMKFPRAVLGKTGEPSKGSLLLSHVEFYMSLLGAKSRRIEQSMLFKEVQAGAISGKDVRIFMIFKFMNG